MIGQVRVDPRRETIRVAHPIEQFEAIPALECEVEHDEAGSPHLDRSDTLTGARRARHSKAVSGEIVEQECPRRLIVLDNQDLPLLVHAGLRPPAEFLGPGADVETAHRAVRGAAKPATIGGRHAPAVSGGSGGSSHE